ncbi:efflux RND transporter periplasmic adaptor subunit [Endozoicomonas sp. OPT23]|uniref:efflux RND transporter periplasmic adaptor subunit n=1 Tax=Endozoicomonas sp. OPT23 TaxID=2072845 RepID=UPI00189166FF|nr:efflux RND transporter periplasmic adaptor subunit [Endozoicomonas sp. OPT23]
MLSRKKLQRLMPGLLTVLAAVVLTGCSEPEQEVKEVIRPVKLFTVQSDDSASLRQFPAKVSASNQADVSFRISGELIDLPVNQADEVKKGQLLARLDDRDIKNELAVRQSDHELAKSSYDRIASLRNKKVVSQSDLDNASAKLKSSQAALRLAEDKLAYSTLKAPFTGRVAQTLVENYQFVQAKETILVLQGSNTLDISIQIPEGIVSQVRKDSIDQSYHPYVIFSSNPDQQFEVIYKEHSTQVTQGTQSYEAVFSLPIPENLTVYPGMAATLTMDLSKVIRVKNKAEVILPLTAVLKDDASGKQQVWLFDSEQNIVNPVTVTVGPITQHGIAITSGVKAGDQVVSAGVNRLRPNMKVKPLLRERGL